MDGAIEETASAGYGRTEPCRRDIHASSMRILVSVRLHAPPIHTLVYYTGPSCVHPHTYPTPPPQLSVAPYTHLPVQCTQLSRSPFTPVHL